MSDTNEQQARPTRPSVPTTTTNTTPSSTDGGTIPSGVQPMKRPGSARTSVTANMGRGAPTQKRVSSPSAGNAQATGGDAKNLANIKTLWTIAQEQKKNQPTELKPKNDVMESYVILMGGEKSGKTCLKYRVQRKDYIKEEPPTTVALEYSYGKREESFKTLVAHFWEVAGGRKLIRLIDDIIQPENINMYIAVIVVDLSKSAKVLGEVQFYLKAIQDCVKAVCSRSQSTDLEARLIARCKRKFNEKHPDINQITFSGIPTVILGTHTDEFEKKSPLHLKTMAHTLRLLAHKNGCSLIYTGMYDTQKTEELDRNFRAMLNYVMFSIQGGLKSETDPLKPIRVVAGKDSTKAIGEVSNESLEKTFVQTFGEDKADDQQGQLEAALMQGFEDNVEQNIDVIRKQKDEELDRFRKKREQEEKEKEQKRLEQAELKKQQAQRQK